MLPFVIFTECIVSGGITNRSPSVKANVLLGKVRRPVPL